MAEYHLHAKTWSRGAGKGAGGHARYILRLGPYSTKMIEQVDGATVQEVEVSRADEVVFTTSAYMPAWAVDPLVYWDTADAFERVNGTVYREIEFALPAELPEDKNIVLATAFAERLARTEKGQTPYTLAIHKSEKDEKLLHCHLMLSDKVNDGYDRTPELWFRRAMTSKSKDPEKRNPGNSGAPKTQERISQTWLGEVVRPLWAELANSALESAGVDVRIDHRSLEEQRIEQEQLAEQARQRGDEVAAVRHIRHARDLDRPAQPKRGRVLEHGGPEKAPGQARLWRQYQQQRVERAAALEAVEAAEREAQQLQAALEQARAVQASAQERHAVRDVEALQRRWGERQQVRRRRRILERAEERHANRDHTHDHRLWTQILWEGRSWEREQQAEWQRGLEQQQAIVELLDGCVPDQARSLDRRIAALRDAAQGVNAAERQRVRRDAARRWEGEQIAKRPIWARAAASAGGWEALPQCWAERRQQEAGGMLAWTPSRRKKAQEWDERLRALEVLLGERRAAMDAAEREREAQQEQAAAAWERLSPHIEAARAEFARRLVAFEGDRKAERERKQREEEARKRQEMERQDRETEQERGPGIRHPDKPRWQRERERILAEAYGEQVAKALGQWYRIQRQADALVLSNREAQVVDHGDRVTAKEGNAREIEAMVLLAQAKGWQSVTLTGSAEFQERAGRAFVEAGIELSDAELQARIEEERAERLRREEEKQRREAEREARRLDAQRVEQLRLARQYSAKIQDIEVSVWADDAGKLCGLLIAGGKRRDLDFAEFTAGNGKKFLKAATAVDGGDLVFIISARGHETKLEAARRTKEGEMQQLGSAQMLMPIEAREAVYTTMRALKKLVGPERGRDPGRDRGHGI